MLRSFMKKFEAVVEWYCPEEPPADIPYKSTTMSLTCMELLTSMIRRTTACHMEDNCILEVFPGNHVVVNNGGTTSGAVTSGLNCWIKKVLLTMWAKMHLEGILDSPAGDGLSDVTVTDIVKFFVMILRVRWHKHVGVQTPCEMLSRSHVSAY